MRKNAKKVMAIVLALVMVVACVGAGIGAYFTGVDKKSDTYVIGQIEVEIVGEDNLYSAENLTPNYEYAFERAVHNTGVNDAYVFMTITLPCDNVFLHNLEGNHTRRNAVLTQLFMYGTNGVMGVNDEWALVTEGKYGHNVIVGMEEYLYNYTEERGSLGNDNTVTYVYAYVGDGDTLARLAPDATTVALFDTMKFANVSDTEEQYNIEETAGQIVTRTYAIQADNVLESTYMQGRNDDGSDAINAVWAVVNNAFGGSSQIIPAAILEPIEEEPVFYKVIDKTSPDEHGRLNAMDEIEEGFSAIFYIIPEANYKLSKLLVNGQDVTADVRDDLSYIIQNVQCDITLKATFEKAVIDISEVEEKSSLDAYSWAEIQAISQADDVSLADYNIKIGDTKTDNGTTYMLVDDDRTGYYDGLVFMFRAENDQANAINKNTGGYPSSRIRTRVDALYDTLPTNLQDVIKTVTIGCNNVGADVLTELEITHHIDVKLFLPSVREVGAAAVSYADDEPYEIYLDRECTYNDVYSFEEAAFDYFYSADADAALAIRKDFFTNYCGKNSILLRSIDVNSRSNFWIIGPGGRIITTYADYGNRAILPVFVIG